jgi:hypothetical protein
MVRIFFTSAIWNLQHRRVATALSRLSFGVASLCESPFSIAAPSFWRAVLTNYQSQTFRRALKS